MTNTGTVDFCTAYTDFKMTAINTNPITAMLPHHHPHQHYAVLSLSHHRLLLESNLAVPVLISYDLKIKTCKYLGDCCVQITINVYIQTIAVEAQK